MKTDCPDTPGRYRLRFLLQEFDLPLGETVVGRADDCNVTIFDPSISRRHVRFIVDEDTVAIEDLGSRNGCRVNGAYIRSATKLTDGDRIRIGTQELVFSEERVRSHVHSRDTGSVCYCSACHASYVKGMDACPHCGQARTSDHDDLADSCPAVPRGRRASGAPPA